MLDEIAGLVLEHLRDIMADCGEPEQRSELLEAASLIG
jgi:hypothetical protein